MQAGPTVAKGARHVLGVGTQAVLVAAIVAAIALAMSAIYPPAGFVSGVQDADAGKGRAGRDASALWATCDPCDTSGLTIRGTGFDRSKAYAWLNFNGATTMTEVSAAGEITHSWPYFDQPGTYWVRAYQPAKGGKVVLVAETTVTVR
jgi:hypothetical protein